MTNDELIGVIMAGNDAALRWYSTVTEKPMATQRPASVMGGVFGADFGSAGPSAQGPMSGGVLIGLVIVAVAAVFIFGGKK